MLKKLAVVVLLAAVVAAYFVFDLGQHLSFQNLKDQQQRLQGLYAEHTLATVLGFCLIYVVMAALSLPGATIMTIGAGVIFGFVTGTVLVSISSTLGATLAFLVSRYLFRDSVQRRFGNRLNSIMDGIRRQGAFYLFTLRLIPVVPFFVINLVFGLTPMKARTFLWVSQLGMLAGTAVYVNAGTQISRLQSAAGILSPALIGSFVLLGVFPWIARRLLDAFQRRRALGRFSRPRDFDYNVVVIGAGSGGLVASYIAAAVKAKVALIEKHRMGGDCLNTGCVPSKALIRSAKMLHHARRAKDWGFRDTTVDFDFGEVMERVQRVIGKVEPHDSVARYTGLGVDCIEGAARIVDPFRVEVNGRTLTTRNIILATGAGPLLPPIPGLADVEPLTSDNLWSLRELPAELVVVGGGPIGCEMAQTFARFGARVTQVEAGPRLMAREDADVVELVTRRFEEEGVRVLTGHPVQRFERAGDRKVVVCDRDGEEVRIECDQVLVALGRKANVTGFGLEELGVQLHPQRGTVQVDEFQRTNYPNIFACGDVAGPLQFTHFAAHQAWYATVNALFHPLKQFRTDMRVIPWTTFTDPEVAHVGVNEQEAREQGVEYQVTRYGIDDLDRAIADGEDYGMVKVLTVPGKDTILGVTIAGPHAGDILTEYVTAMKHGIGLNQILGTVHTYPTLGEANKYAAGVWKNATKPEAALRFLERFHGWRRSGAVMRRIQVAGGALATVVGLALLMTTAFCTVVGDAPDLAAAPDAPYREPVTDRYAAVLARVVNEAGQVDYPALAADHADLDAYLHSLAYQDRAEYDGWSRERQLAFWANAYNALTLGVVVENYPIGRSLYGIAQGAPAGSIRQIPWVWQKVQFTVMGESMTLDHIEHAILRPQFGEPRVHMFINCASVGCPPLAREPLRAETLDAQLDGQTRRFLSNPDKFRIDRAAKVVHLSPIFQWFGGDFVERYAPAQGFGDHDPTRKAVLNFVASYTGSGEQEFLREGDYVVEFLGYDWSLNESR